MADHSEFWRRYLTGESGTLLRSTMKRLPSSPRCKLCAAPFAGPFAPALKLVGFRRWKLNHQLCRVCVRSMEKHVGGAEIPVSLMYVDVRGSTTLAETMSPTEMSSRLNDLFDHVGTVVDREDGVIDHIVGDGVMAMWIPGFVGEAHAHHALSAGLGVSVSVANDAKLAGRLPVGCGVHTGTAYVGVVGALTSSLDFTVVGDVANTTARLGSLAGPGELLASDAILRAAGRDADDYEGRRLHLRGKSEILDARVVRPAAAS
jgi:adenylate cyclase